MAEEFPEEKRNALHDAYTEIFHNPFAERYEQNWGEETFWEAVEVFKVKMKELEVENPFDFFGKYKLGSYELIRDKCKAGPPLCVRKSWKSPAVGEKVDVLGLLERLHHISGNKYEGKEDIVVIEFWATWCGPCTELAPELSDLAEKHTGRVAVMGINNDGPTKNGEDDVETVQDFVEERKEKFRYAQYVDNAENYAKTSLDKTEYMFYPGLIIVVGGTIKFVGEKAWFKAHLEETLKTSCPEE
ncbi:hypothetical protein BGZ83_000967 [Gryganskiella cystojenkinii]|nr:hypothetical protein BGZ83_000967 [Gryganskiella cystojenkinii]